MGEANRQPKTINTTYHSPPFERRKKKRIMKLEITIGELAQLVGGELQMASMPPLGGKHEPAGRVVGRLSQVQPGDVFAAAEDVDCAVEEAYARGASGVIVERLPMVPWAGRYVIRVADAEVAWRTIQAYGQQITACPTTHQYPACGATRGGMPVDHLEHLERRHPLPLVNGRLRRVCYVSREFVALPTLLGRSN